MKSNPMRIILFLFVLSVVIAGAYVFAEQKESVTGEHVAPIEEEAASPLAGVTLLDIASDLQDRALSCEAASLKMALAGKSVSVTEAEIMARIGYDRTPHKGGVWGDPNEAFVGNIDGHICEDGYGVYAPAVARAAGHWRQAENISRMSLGDLVREIAAGNPVIVWGTLPVDVVHECSWHTPEGIPIKAFWETHVRLAVGFHGDLKNPSHIVLNDPLEGRITWTTDYFLKNWERFDYSGVVVR